MDESVVRKLGDRLAPGLSAKVKVRVDSNIQITTPETLPGKLTQR
jgi:hypothetical protein